MLKILSSGVGKSTRSRLLFLAGALLFAALVVASSLVGIPHDAHGTETLPGIALGWRLLFHIERAGVALGVMTAILLIAWRGAHGEWPIRFGNLEYAPKASIDATADIIAAMDDRLDFHDTRLRKLEGRGSRSPGGKP